MYDSRSKDIIIGKQWLVLSKIGQGSFGEVFKVRDVHSNRFYAIKRESSETKYPQLHHENTMYGVLKDGPCIPKCHWYGQYDGYDCIVIDLLGFSLKELQQTVKLIPLDIVIEIGCQLISCLEYIHDKGLVYRDIKPENFLFSESCAFQKDLLNRSTYAYDTPPSPPSSCPTVINSWNEQKPVTTIASASATSVYIVDFGLTAWWQNPKTKRPYPESRRPIKFKTGTARYASLNVHRGQSHARRDDMESLGYVLLDLLLAGQLPWSGVTARTSKAGWDRLKTIKETIPLEDLCQGLPHGIMNFIDHTRRLRFHERPDYQHLRELLRACNQSGPLSALVSSKDQIKKAVNSVTMQSSSFHDQDVFKMDDLFKELPTQQTYHFQPSRAHHHHHHPSFFQHKNQHSHNKRTRSYY